jgi:hypothetical protein
MYSRIEKTDRTLWIEKGAESCKYGWCLRRIEGLRIEWKKSRLLVGLYYGY